VLAISERCLVCTNSIPLEVEGQSAMQLKALKRQHGEALKQIQLLEEIHHSQQKKIAHSLEANKQLEERLLLLSQELKTLTESRKDQTPLSHSVATETEHVEPPLSSTTLTANSDDIVLYKSQVSDLRTKLKGLADTNRKLIEALTVEKSRYAKLRDLVRKKKTGSKSGHSTEGELNAVSTQHSLHQES
jgi:hypothetical protein